MRRMIKCINCKIEFEEEDTSMFEHPLISKVCSNECFREYKENKWRRE